MPNTLLHLQGWNPESAFDPGKASVVLVGPVLGYVSLLVGRHYAGSGEGGLLTPDTARRLAAALAKAADDAEGPS